MMTSDFNNSTRRRNVLFGGLAALVAGNSATPAGAAAEAGRSFRIGLLHYVHKDDKFISTVDVGIVRDELQNLGYKEGGNTVYLERYGERDLEATKRLAAEMVESKVDVICSFIANANIAAKAATGVSRTPVVCWSSFSVQEGLAQSYRRPGGNFTGFSCDPTTSSRR